MGLGLLVLSLLSAAGRLLDASTPETYIFARQYNAKEDKVAIRSLWTETPGQWLHNCNQRQIDWRTLASLKYTLNAEWPSYDNTPRANQDHWTQQWQRHGACTSLSPFGYFSTGIDLHTEYDIREALRQDKASTLSIAEDVQRAYGVVPLVHEIDKHDHIFEIWMCFDKALMAKKCSPAAQKSIWTSFP